MKRAACLILGFLVAMLCTAGSAPAAGRVNLHLLSDATITSDTICLGQIARISADRKTTGDTMAKLVLGPSPRPGRSMYIHQGKVASLLQANGYAADQFSITAAGPVKVLRGYEDLTAKRVTDAVRAFILSCSPWDRDQIKIRSISYRQHYQLPPGKLDLRVSAPKHTDWIGAIPFQVDAYINGRRVQRMSVPAHIEVWGDVIVAAKPLARRQPLAHDDIKIKRMNLSRVPKNAMLGKDQVIGNRTTTAIAPNAVICTDDIEMPPAVRRGDVIQLVAESPMLRITTKGVAKDKGAVGDRIRVLNIRSKKVIYAQIMDQSTARVSY